MISIAKNKKMSLSDMPFTAEENDFGTDRYVNGLIKFIKNTAAPITIALQGEWGSGKTSLMIRLYRALCSENSPFVGIEINTWEYSMLSSPQETVFKIIKYLVDALSQDDTTPKKTFQNFLKSSRGAFFRGAREAVKMIPGVGIVLEAANIPTTLQEEEIIEDEVTLSELKKTLEKSIQKLKETTNKNGVIIFIDDLDRLNPPIAVEILELLKNIFCVDDCIFVLAIDYEVVVKGLEPKFGKLTSKNEREFRSFFDKIIQVPFSLPVSSYRPMNFVLDSLVKIGYIKPIEKEDEEFINFFQDIVEHSVGKNPRSIKRLLNTLSLLLCIAQCGEDVDADYFFSHDGRLVNFAIVAIQVCYPKIYRLLANEPNFLEWDDIFADRMGYPILKDEDEETEEDEDIEESEEELDEDEEVEEGDEEENEELEEDESVYETNTFKNKNWSEEDDVWANVLVNVCVTDKYLDQHFYDIRDLLLWIKRTLIKREKEDGINVGQRMQYFLDKSSVTGVSENIQDTPAEQNKILDKLHENVVKNIQFKRPDIKRILVKKNTGKGGFSLPLPQGEAVEITIRPRESKDKTVFELLLPTEIARPNRLIGKTFEEILKENKVKTIITAFDEVISPLLQMKEYFEGNIYPEKGAYFPSFIEEQMYLSNRGGQSYNLTQKVVYKLNLTDRSKWEEEIIDILADIIIATYDLRLAAQKLE